MATIPVASLRGVNAAQAPNRVDAQAASAAFGGLAQLGSGIAQVGDTLSRIAIDRQMHVNKGILANEDIIRQNTFAEVEKFTAANKNNPEAWDAFAKEKWTEYEDGRKQRMETEGWGPAVREQDTMDMQQFSARADRVYETEKNRALIRQSNARLDSLAQTYSDNGDFEAAAQVIRQTDRYDDEKNAMVERVINEGIYNRESMNLTAIKAMTPAQRSTEAATLAGSLLAKDDKGQFTGGLAYGENGETIGRLSIRERDRLVAEAAGVKKAANDEMMNNVRGYLPLIAQNPKLANIMMNEALERGDINWDVVLALEPELLRTYQRGAEGRTDDFAKKLEAAQKAQAAQAKSQIEAGMRLMETARKGDVTVGEIRQMQALGNINAKDARAALSIIEPQARMEIDPAYVIRSSSGKEIKDSTNIRERINTYAARASASGMDISFEEQVAILGDINRIQGISRQGRVELMKRFTEALATDFKDESEWVSANDGGQRHNLIAMGIRDDAADGYRGKSGRTVSREEKDVRVAFYNELASTANLDTSWAGALMIEMEPLIQERYAAIADMPIDNPQQIMAKMDAVDQLKKEVMGRVKQTISDHAIQSLFDQ